MALALALLADALIGEPNWLWSRLPHPAVLMGRLICWAEARFNTGRRRKWAGCLLTAAIITSSVAIGLGLHALPGFYAEIVVCAVLLAQRSLADHVTAVANALPEGLNAGRRAVAQIVGRDTGEMDEPAIARAAIESAAENFSDGVLAPAFWFAVAGLPGIIAHKFVNTADSMIGYKTPRHAEFGWAAARLDDLMNLIPARLSALVFCLAGLRPGALRIVWRDARLHRSPNAGWPEAAMAAILGVALAGPRSYDAETRDYPYVHPEGRRAIGAAEISAAVRLLWRGWALLCCAALVIWLA